MECVSGDILTNDGFQKGYISFEENKILAIEKGTCQKKPITKGFIIPTFINAHTHIGDSFIRKRQVELPRSVKELVGPPDGLKHRLLRNASDNEIVNGMKECILEMESSGVSVFCDFREGGIKGVNLLQQALNNQSVSSLIFSRPHELTYDGEEINTLLQHSDGIGLSSISDFDNDEIIKIAKHVKRKGKLLGLHASERIRENIDTILDLKPDFLVHMLKATESDLIRVKEQGIPVVICPRSNHFFGLQPRYDIMKKTHVTFLIGTDNAMINTTSILDEILFIRQQTQVFTIDELLYNSTYLARKALNLKEGIPPLAFPASFQVLDQKTLAPCYMFLSGV
ncbi:MAG: amidohydrolase family protein [Thermoplasmatota archaeon]